MLNTVKPILLSLLLASGSTAFAQETTTDAAPAEDATPSDLSMGELEIPSEPITAEELAALRPGQFYVLQVHDDWKIRCVKTAEGQSDPCQLYQLLLDDNGNPVAEISIYPLPEGGRAAAGANIVAPLETLLTEQLTLSVDGGQGRRYPFTFCNQGGCVSRVGFTAEEIAQFKRGNGAQIRMVPAAAPDQEVILTMSLAGFTAGFEGSYATPE